MAVDPQRVEVTLPAELVELIAQQAAELAVDLLAQRPEAWIGVEQAAAHISAPTSRVYSLVSAKRIPFCKDGSRVLFKRSQLDAWIEAGGGLRP